MKPLPKNRLMSSTLIGLTCFYIGCIAVLGLLSEAEWLFYYTAFGMLGVGILFDGFITIGSLAQLIAIKRRKIKEEGANAFVLLQLLQSAASLVISIVLLTYLRGGMIASWIIFAGASLLSLIDIAVRRYRLYNAGQAEWFWGPAQ